MSPQCVHTAIIALHSATATLRGEATAVLSRDRRRNWIVEIAEARVQVPRALGILHHHWVWFPRPKKTSAGEAGLDKNAAGLAAVKIPVTTSALVFVEILNRVTACWTACGST